MKRLRLASSLCLGFLSMGAVVRADTIISVTETHYDVNQRPDCVAQRMNPATFADLPSNACALKTAGSFGNDRIAKTVYDNAGQIAQVIQGYASPGKRTYATYSYSSNGKVIDSIDANGNRSHAVYDAFDRLQTFYYPSASKPSAFNAATQATALSTAGSYSVSDYETFTYDANGNRLTSRRRDGQMLTDCFDALNRLVVHYLHSQTGCTATGGAKDIYTVYDLQGHILSKRFASSSGSGVSYLFDGIGQVTSTTDMYNRTVSYLYNSAGSRTRLTDANAYYVVYDRDGAERLTQASLNGTADVLFGQTFNTLGHRTLLNRGASAAGGKTTYAFDNLGRLQGMAIDIGGTSTAYDVTWGKVGTVGTVAYNPAGQITAWPSTNTVFDYIEPTSAVDNPTFDGLNRDAGVAALTGGYDMRGNLTFDGTRTFTYDIENRLLTAAGGVNNLSLIYDPEGRLVRITSGSTTRDLLYDGVDLIMEYNANGTVASRYIHGPGTDDPLVWLQGADSSDRHYYYTNYQGSVVGYTGSTGTLEPASLAIYGTYGEPRNASNNASWSGMRFGYTGQMVLADAALYYYKARVYDPGSGRFLQTDPIGSKDDLNLYAYVGGDPVNATDPMGLYTCKTIVNGRTRSVSCDVTRGLYKAIQTASTSRSLSEQERNNMVDTLNILGAPDERNGFEITMYSGQSADGRAAQATGPQSMDIWMDSMGSDESGGGKIAHEVYHNDMNTRGRSATNRSQEYEEELRGYERYDQVLRGTSGSSVSEDNRKAAAESSTDLWCQSLVRDRGRAFAASRGCVARRR